MIGGDRSSLTGQLVVAQVKIHESQTLRKIRNSSWKMKRTKKSGATMAGDRSSLTGKFVVAQVNNHESQTLRKIRNSS